MVTFVASSASTSGNTNVTSLGVMLPGDWRPGLLALCVGIANSTTATLAFPPGWTLLDGAPLTVGSSRLFVAAKVLGAREIPPTFTLSTPLKTSAALALYSGVNAAAPYLVGTSVTRPGSQATSDAGPVTTIDDDQTVVALYAEKSSTASSVTDPPGTTRRAAKFGAGGGGVSVLVVDRTLEAPGSSGVMTATYNVASNVGYGLAVALVDGPPPETGLYQLSGGVLVARRPYALDDAQAVALPDTWDLAGVTLSTVADYLHAELVDLDDEGVLAYRIISSATLSPAAATPGVRYRIGGQARTNGGTTMRSAVQFYRSDGTYIPDSLVLGEATLVDVATFTDLAPLEVVAPPGARRLAVAYGLDGTPAGSSAMFDVRPQVTATRLD